MTMMTDKRTCKGCRGDYRVTEEQIERFLSQLAKQPEICVPDSVYEERLQMCRECPKLIDGHTCVMCGCIVQVTAKLKAKSCPRPGGAGWQQYDG